MKTLSFNLKKAALGTIILSVCSLIVSCSSPRVFQFQDIQYFTSSSGQAQLGNLGIMTAEDGFGFQRSGFLSDCQDTSLSVSVDATIHGLLPLQNAFGAGTRAKQLSVLLGVPVDQLSESSVLLFSINPLDAQRDAANWPETCKSMIARDSIQTRLIISVGALLPYRVLPPEFTSNQLTAQISARGNLTLTVHAKKKVQINVSPQTIFAWRSGHFCWREDSNEPPILRSDDPGFDACPEGYDTLAPAGSPWSTRPLEEAESENADSEAPEEDESSSDESTPTPESE